MREFEFRGKSIRTGEWKHGSLFTSELSTCIIVEEGVLVKPDDVNGPAEYDSEPVFYEVFPESVGQFTGYMDMNKRRIYEGQRWKRSNFIGIVTFVYGGWQFEKAPDSSCYSYPYVHSNAHLGEVIDDPEPTPEVGSPLE